MREMRPLFLLILFVIANAQLFSQTVSDTMHIGASSYVEYKVNQSVGVMHARIVSDSILTIYDSSGIEMDYKIQRWLFCITREGAYQEVKITGNVLPENCRQWVNAQPSGGWICIEGVKVLMPDGTERQVIGEKWVKL